MCQEVVSKAKATECPIKDLIFYFNFDIRFLTDEECAVVAEHLFGIGAPCSECQEEWDRTAKFIGWQDWLPQSNKA